MSSTKHIFTLPFDILTSLFVDWSNVVNISFLDSACCNKIDRKILLDLLQHKYATYCYVDLGTTCNNVSRLFMKYVFTRGIKLSNFF
jgi:hypothetical protein